MTGSQQQFTIAFKKKTVEYMEAHGNLTPQHKFGATEKCIRYWRIQKQRITTCNSQKKTSFLRWTTVYPEMEAKVAEFIRGLHA